MAALGGRLGIPSQFGGVATATASSSYLVLLRSTCVSRKRMESVQKDGVGLERTEMRPVWPFSYAQQIRNGATNPTAYPPPAHENAAMHSAASNISFWLQIVLKATDAQICAAMKVDYAVSYARTVAGVHYPTDNIDGLNMGMRTLAKELPKYFAEKFGGDYEYIKKKVEIMLFDWNDVNPTNIKYCQTAQQKNRFNTKPLYGPFFDQYCPAEDGSVTRDSKNAAAHDFTL